MKKFIILIVFILLTHNAAFAQSMLVELDKFKEIKILESTRDDVRRIFAGYEFKNNNLSEYREWFNTPNVSIEFAYSRGKCDSEDTNGYDASEWKVEFVHITLKNTIKFEDIKPSLAGFGAKSATYKKEKKYINDDIYVFHNKDLGIGLEINENRVQEIIFIAPKRYYSLICDKKIAKRLSSTKSFFTRPLKERKLIVSEPPFGGVSDLKLSHLTIRADCIVNDSGNNKVCSDNVKQVEVLTVSNDPDNDDFVTFNYSVSGGKVIGTGKKIVWDLSGVKPGIYKITARVDDGCGICGQTVTKEIKVIECPGCLINDPF